MRLTILIFIMMISLVTLPLSQALAKPKGSNPDDYDPFSDFSDYNGDDEAPPTDPDYYMRNGSSLTVGGTYGYRSFTSSLGEIYHSGTNYGIFVRWYFQSNMALHIAYVLGDHPIDISAGGQNFSGNVNLTSTMYLIKYDFKTLKYFKKKFLLNPYVIGGLSQNYRTYRLTGGSTYNQDQAISFDAGAGIEYPIMKNKVFVGLQFLYNYIRFADEDAEIQLRDGSGSLTGTGKYPRGDVYSLSMTFGLNF